MKKYRLLPYFFLFISFFGIIRSGYSEVAKTLLGTTTANPTGTYTSKAFPTTGYTWFRGHIITDGSVGGANQPTGYIEQSLSTAAPLSYHGTDTITFSRSGSLWTGSINSAIIGGYARLVIGNFGDAALLAINWFVTPETSVNTTLNLTTVTTGSETSQTVGTTSKKILEVNSNRRYFIIQGNVDFRLSWENPADATKMLIEANAGYESEPQSSVYTGELYAITESGTATIYVQERN